MSIYIDIILGAVYNQTVISLTARQKVLDYLGKHPEASANQIGHAVGIAPASVRHHLAVLQADGRIAMAGERRSGSRGRPTKTYRLSERLRGDNLAGLVSALLDALSSSRQGGDKAEHALAQGLLQQLGPLELAGSAQRRLGSLVDKLNSLHYEASWEAGEAGPRLLFGHCPYAAVIAKHPELCRMDSQMLGAQLGVGATQIAKIEDRLGGQTHCIFVLKE